MLHLSKPMERVILVVNHEDLFSIEIAHSLAKATLR